MRFLGVWLLAAVLGMAAAFGLPHGAAASLTPLHSFSAVDDSQVNSDGANPASALLLGQDGALYGTTFDGGANGAGTVFRLPTTGTGHMVLHILNAGTEGSSPMGKLIQDAKGLLYGTTSGGGPLGGGTIFRLAADGSGFTLLHSFPGDNGAGGYPSAGLTVGSDGLFYGTTTGGSLGTGVVYRMAPDGSGFTVLHRFTEGDEPLSRPVVGGDGFLYGTTFYGGDSGVGTLYKLSPDGKTFVTVYSFTGGGDGGYPQAAPTAAGDGFLYGTTSDSQLIDGYGTVYKVKTDGTAFATLYNFSGGSDGGTPLAPLVRGPGGALYGTTFSGGSDSGGTIFQINPDGSGFLTLAAFPGSGVVGGGPSAGLTLGPDGALYGTASEGDSLRWMLDESSDPMAADPDVPTYTGSVFRFVSSLHVDLLWTHTSGAAAVWTVQPDGTRAIQVYGPFPGWSAKALSEGPDGHGRLLWTHTNGQAALWNLGDASPAATAALYGPFPGWTAKALTVGPDNAAHLLWDNSDGRVALWNTTDDSPAATALVAGPFAGWSGTAIGIGADNQERLLWNHVSGQAAVWNTTDDSPAATALVAGPFAGWTAKTISVGPDNAAHLLWDHVSGQVAVWNLSDPSPVSSALLYGPYSGWSGMALSVGPDNAAHLLWDNTSGSTSLWNLSDINPAASYALFGPFDGWTGVAVAAGQ